MTNSKKNAPKPYEFKVEWQDTTAINFTGFVPGKWDTFKTRKLADRKVAELVNARSEADGSRLFCGICLIEYYT